MVNRYLIVIFIIFFSGTYASAQKRFKVISKETANWRSLYSLVDEHGRVIRHLDSAKYTIFLGGREYGYFAIFSIKGTSGWVAIDANETKLFQVYNMSPGEPSPDFLVENKIRIVDQRNKIGFANHLGQIIIKPKFELATSFHKGKAIVGQTCKILPWGNHADEEDCQHFSTICEKHGYINTKGVLLKIGNYSFEDIVKEIKWEQAEELW